jgi:O-antigen/teichoic acid export membrane protein
MGFFTGLMVASSPFDQMLIIEERTDLASILLVLWDLTRGAFLLGAALLTNDLNSALWAMTFAALLLYLAMLLYLRYRYRLTWRKISLSVFRRHVAFSSSMTVQSAAHLIESQTDKYAVMLLFCTNTYAIYSVGAFQLPIVQMVFSSITTVILPRLASLYSAGEIHRLIDLWNDAIRKSAIILFPVFALLLNVYSEFIIVLFTTNYVESIPIFVIYIWTIPTYIMANNLLLQATGHERYLFLTGLIKPILAVAIIALGIYFAGLLGAAAGLVVYQYVSKYLYAWFSARALKVPLLQLIPGRALIHISVLMLIASIPTLYFEMFVKLSPFALLFAKTAIFCSVVTMLYIFSSVLTIEDRAKIRSLVNTAISKLSRKQQTSSERDETSPRKSE